MPTKPSKVLRKAAALLERGWCQGAAARDERGHGCHPTAPIACKWCWLGALFVAANEKRNLTNDCERYGRRAIHNHDAGLPSWNDQPYRTQAEVVAACLRAAELAEGEGQ